MPLRRVVPAYGALARSWWTLPCRTPHKRIALFSMGGCEPRAPEALEISIAVLIMRTAYTVYYSARPGRKIRQRGSYTQESRQAASHSHQGIRKGPRQGIGQGPRPNIWPLAGHTYVRSPKHEPTYVYGRGASGPSGTRRCIGPRS